MKVLVTGSRDYGRSDYIYSMFSKLKQGINFPSGNIRLDNDTTIIHGGCRGVDNVADYVAKHMKYKVKVFSAEWDIHGRSAGPIRNKHMLQEEPDIILAFHPRLMDSKGTKNMVQMSLKACICPIILIWGDPKLGQYIELPNGGKLEDWSWFEIEIDEVIGLRDINGKIIASNKGKPFF